ncbi:hypothetical protein L6452_32757 [Arctium lappa]|uniref:Uncharacterized protein n=1 Tax=Arctium lappa TaxID=4217 RepID=A0ACB8Z4K6_ARCLA|nr:hypothetical protein L6452_32757 [Arctium lappa]
MVSRSSVRTSTPSGEDVKVGVSPTRQGRGRGRTTSLGAAPSAQASSTACRVNIRPKATGRVENPFTEEVLTERMTQVLQNTLSAMLEAVLENRHKQEEKKRVKKKTKWW